jgi:D-beta-D-heptose 7-phosphate kinase/D-beta-D-heptose 1-phosphate adenosyltransferase
MKYIVVSGGMDPIHIGHIRYFKEAKQLGDKLIVILNKDRFLQKKKGYVFMPYKERKEVLEAIKYINEVVPCLDKDQSVRATIKRLKEKGKIDVFAKGGDRTIKNIPEKDLCNKLDIQMVFGVGGGDKPQSSSWLVDRIWNEGFNVGRKEGLYGKQKDDEAVKALFGKK